MSYLSNAEESELKRLKFLTMVNSGMKRVQYKSAILEVAKRRRVSTLTEPAAAAPTAAATAKATAEALMAPAAAVPAVLQCLLRLRAQPKHLARS